MRRARLAGLVALSLGAVAWPAFADPPSPVSYAPTIRDVLSLERVAYPVPSPDGSAVVFSRRTTDWDRDAFDLELWLLRLGKDGVQKDGFQKDGVDEGDVIQEPLQLTRTVKGSSTDPAWSPDSRWIGFLADRGAGRQVHVISSRGGEARPLTAVKGGVKAFAWSADGKGLILKLRDGSRPALQARQKTYGKFRLESRPEARHDHLWWLDVEAAFESPNGLKIDPRPWEPIEPEPAPESEPVQAEPVQAEPVRRLTGGDFTVREFDVSPVDDRVVFSHRPSSDVDGVGENDISWLDFGSPSPGEALHPVTREAGRDASPLFSPDGGTVVFESAAGEPELYGNRYLAVVELPASSEAPASAPRMPPAPKILSRAHDGRPALVAWTEQGIFFSDQKRTERKIFRLDPSSSENTAAIQVLDHFPAQVWSAAPMADGDWVLFGQNTLELAEIWRCPGRSDGPACRSLTEAGRQIASWRLGSRELVRWTARDGLEIEAVLYRPDPVDGAEDAPPPLVVLVHGGPVTASYAETVPGAVYPVLQWLADGVSVLMPNYRGSDGYGKGLRQAAIGALGRAEVEDVLDGIEELATRGVVDPERVASAGWSQGGFIAAMAALTEPERIRGASVGAGISDWSLYYAATDLRSFAPTYFEGLPREQAERYRAASVLERLDRRVADGSPLPAFLIQHGDRDGRVPLVNGQALFRALEDAGAEVELLVYRGAGHTVSSPKQRLGAAEHNRRWVRYLFGLGQESLDLGLDE